MENQTPSPVLQDQVRKQALENLESAYNSKASKNYNSQNTFIGNYTSIKESEKRSFDHKGQTQGTMQNVMSTQPKHAHAPQNKENENSLN